jgi:hypothetical protein
VLLSLPEVLLSEVVSLDSSTDMLEELSKLSVDS